MGGKLVFDLETKKTFQEVGGQRAADRLGISLVGVYSYERQQFKTFREAELGELGRWMAEAELIIGFNSKAFDNAVLQPYLSLDLSRLPHLDILEQVTASLGHRLKLDTLAQGTLLEEKAGDGLDAILYYQRGEWDKLEYYCLKDVQITRDLYEYGQRHSQLWFPDSGRLLPVPIRWGSTPTVADTLQQALQTQQHVEVQYLGDASRLGQRPTRTFEVRQLVGDQVRGWCHTTARELNVPVRTIFNARLIGRVNGIQGKLL